MIPGVYGTIPNLKKPIQMTNECNFCKRNAQQPKVPLSNPAGFLWWSRTVRHLPISMAREFGDNRAASAWSYKTLSWPTILLEHWFANDATKHRKS